MYDSNPTLEGIKTIDESKQGSVFFKEQIAHGKSPGLKHFYIESYGCQMNFSDSEIVASILGEVGYAPTRNMEESDLILINTCSIREKAEETVRKRLKTFEQVKSSKPELKVGVLGCMAERLKKKWLEEEKLVDLVVGPDAYRDLPNLIGAAEEGNRMVNVLLSREETYADISPVRLETNGVTAFISIMRGCDNMCSFCVVPFTRGRERSETGEHTDFADLLEMTALVHADLRVRFSTSHPKDMTDKVLHTMARYDNICEYIHLPVQSGNSRVLELMNRTYDREWYMERIDSIRRILPEAAVSSDIITGFCSETEEEHQETLSIMEYANFSMSYMFAYSERPGTLAARKYADDIPEDVKKRRLNEVIRLQTALAHRNNQLDIGKTFKVLVERDSSRSSADHCGRNSQNKMCVFPKKDGVKPGDYVMVRIHDATSA
ncbi:MAG: radical SAM protein [Saprospiraceae bacterium]|nr:radical SAM protein [Saprospiraceae bacterium]